MYGDWIDTRQKIAEVPTDEEMHNAILNPQTPKQNDIDDGEVGNSERPTESLSNQHIGEIHCVPYESSSAPCRRKKLWAVLLLRKHG